MQHTTKMLAFGNTSLNHFPRALSSFGVCTYFRVVERKKLRNSSEGVWACYLIMRGTRYATSGPTGVGCKLVFVPSALIY